jgi:two-component system phosphate regulon sensor histidine kinase PhoR
MRFRNRFILAFVLLLLVALIVPYFAVKREARNVLLQEAKDKARQHLEHTRWLFNNELRFEDPMGLQEWLKAGAKHLNLRLTYIAEGGRVIADSSVSYREVGKLDNHSERPEIAAAREDGGIGWSVRYSSTVQAEFIYAAVKVAAPSGLPGGFLRVAVPYTHVERKLMGMNSFWAGVVLVCILLTGSLIWLLSRQLRLEIAKLSQAAEDIGQGRLDRKIEFRSGPDFLPLVRSINRMAKKIRSDLEIIREQKNELEAILNGLQEGVLVLNSQGKVIKSNPAFLQLSSVKSSIQGREPIELIRSTELQDLCSRIVQDPQARDPVTILVQLPKKQIFQVTVLPVWVAEHQDRDVIVVFHDITELKRLEEVRKDFVANVSHELRTPLTSIKGYAETLSMGQDFDSETIRSFMGVILKNANAMNDMLSELLQLARLESMEPSQDLKPVNLASALESAWQICTPFAREKDIELKSELPEKGVTVRSDFDQLLSVLVNLLENAIKFSPEHDLVRVFASEKDDEWVVSIQDNGPGVPASIQDRIFERFFRGEADSADRKTEGTGLGLSICRHIIRNQNGRIWVQSPAEGLVTGSVFSFSLQKP